jgi:toxin ParE1/3/4
MNTYKVTWTKAATNDLDRIIDFIAQDSVNSALKQFQKITESARNLYSFPEKDRLIPELFRQNIHKYRELIITPWRVMYKVENKNVYVLAVIDGRRNIEDILLNRQLR